MSEKTKTGKFRPSLRVVLSLIMFTVGFGIAWKVKGTSSAPSSGADTATQREAAQGKQIWTCSMHPQIRRDKPGSCPICGMDLVQVTQSEGGPRTVTISPAARKLMRIQTSPVERKYVTAEVRMVGKIDYDETRLFQITAWVSGRLDRLYVDYTGVSVAKGDHLVYIYSEELYSAQIELLQAIENKKNNPNDSVKTTLIQPLDLAASAREKLRLLGLTPEQIQEIEQRGTAAEHLTIYSPIGGIVIEKLREEGDRVRTGDRIYTVADLSHLWVKLDAYESDLVWIRYGQDVEFTTEAYPGEVFHGRISFIDPILNEATRTVKVRVNVANEQGRLKPEMFVRAIVRSKIASGGKVLDQSLAGKWISPMHPEIMKDEPGNCDICNMPLVRAESLGYVSAQLDGEAKPLVIPVTAALVTGTRAIVYVEQPRAEKPTFDGREIVLGPRAGDYYLVKNGLKEGEIVVTNGNFKLDSALQISAKPSMMTPEGGGGMGGGAAEEMSLPRMFRDQLFEILDASKLVTTRLEEADLEKLRKAFVQLKTAIRAIDGKKLSGHMKMQWDELSMLLDNDAVIGSDLKSLERADQLHLVLKRHIERLREAFGLLSDDDDLRIKRIEVPEAFQKQLNKLWDAYFPIGAGLAADDLEATRQAILALQSTLRSIKPEGLQKAAAEKWENELANFQKIHKEFLAAKDLKETRAAFALLSDEMLMIEQAFGTQRTEPVFELHCPMAFKGRGASWFQNDDKTRNPYFGKSMLKCADSARQLLPKNKE